MRRSIFVLFVFTVLSFFACGGGGGSSDSNRSDYRTSSLELTSAEYEDLSAMEKYAVVNKLTGALYKGVAANEFFNLSNGVTPPVIGSNAMDLAAVRSALGQPMDDKSGLLARIDEKYYFQERAWPIQFPLAMLYEFPLSRDYFCAWMAYRLANTILFSPALELETCNYVDIHRVFQRLLNMIEDGNAIRDIVYEHMISQENWRRFRSPEDNTREMMEIFLARFKDDEVPRASLACKNWSLTDDALDYQLVIGYDENTDPQQILDTTVTGCYDFYRAVADHADLMPRITSVLVDSLLAGTPADVRQRVVDTIVSENPTVFEDIFIPIIFSREFLLDTERPAQLEERFFNIADRIDWVANTKFFNDINHAWSGSTYPSLKNMRQAAFTYKLGRPAEVPVDTLSFSYFHKAVRERLLLDRCNDPLNPDDGGWLGDFLLVGLDGDDYIKYLFLDIVSRLPSDTELSELRQIIEDRGYARDGRLVHRAMIVMEYLSRLSETYYMNAVD